MKKLPISLLGGIGSIVITVILYAMILGDRLSEEVCLITMIGVVIAEIITTLLAYLAGSNPRKVVAAGLSAVLVPFSVALSYYYIENKPEEYGRYFGIYFIGIIAVVVVAFILFSFNAKREEEDKSLQSSKNVILNLRKIAKCIMADPAAQPYEAAIREIEEKLHFSNDSVTVSQDEKIYYMLTELQDNISNPEFNKEESIKNISRAIDMRNIMASRNV